MRRIRIRCAAMNAAGAFMLALLASIPTARGQWVATNGPTGAMVSSVVSTESYLFAGTQGAGAYRSKDHGRHWIAMGLGNASVYAMASLDSDVFSATDHGIFRSSPPFTEWVEVDSGLGYSDYRFLCTAGSYVFAGPKEGGLFVSSDAGKHWSSVSNGLPNLPILNCLASSGAILLTGILHHGIYVSHDTGNTWQWASESLRAESVVSLVGILDTVLFAQTSDSGIIRSTDSGAHWVRADLSYQGSVSGMAPAGQNMFFWGSEGLARSTDEGVSWNRASLDARLATLKTIIQENDTLYGATFGDGIIASLDSGTTWKDANNGLRNTEVLHLSALNNSLIATVGYLGLQASSDAGTLWQSEDSSFPSGYLTGEVSMGSDMLICGSSLGENSASLLRSSDDGVSWGAPVHLPPTRIAASLSCLFRVNAMLYAGTSDGLFFSTDTGLNWISVTQGLPDSNILSIAGDSSHLFVSVGNGEGMAVSTDGGMSWTPVVTPIALDYATALTFNKSTLFAGCEAGIFMSTNYGFTWKAVNDGLSDSNILSLAVLDTNLYAGTSSRGVWRRPVSEMIGASEVALSPPNQGAISATVYPNPVSENLNIQISLKRSSNVHFSLVNLLGEKFVDNYIGELGSGQHAFTQQVQALPAGLYECIVESDNQVLEIPLAVDR